MDPFEFIRESHVSSIFNNKSIYTIRKNIGKLQAEFLSKKNIDAEYDLCRTRLYKTYGIRIQHRIQK